MRLAPCFDIALLLRPRSPPSQTLACPIHAVLYVRLALDDLGVLVPRLQPCYPATAAHVQRQPRARRLILRLTLNARDLEDEPVTSPASAPVTLSLLSLLAEHPHAPPHADPERHRAGHEREHVAVPARQKGEAAEREQE